MPIYSLLENARPVLDDTDAEQIISFFCEVASDAARKPRLSLGANCLSGINLAAHKPSPRADDSGGKCIVHAFRDCRLDGRTLTDTLFLEMPGTNVRHYRGGCLGLVVERRFTSNCGI